jgi:hypothetical protein
VTPPARRHRPVTGARPRGRPLGARASRPPTSVDASAPARSRVSRPDLPPHPGTDPRVRSRPTAAALRGRRQRPRTFPPESSDRRPRTCDLAPRWRVRVCARSAGPVHPRSAARCRSVPSAGRKGVGERTSSSPPVLPWSRAAPCPPPRHDPDQHAEPSSPRGTASFRRQVRPCHAGSACRPWRGRDAGFPSHRRATMASVLIPRVSAAEEFRSGAGRSARAPGLRVRAGKRQEPRLRWASTV